MNSGDGPKRQLMMADLDYMTTVARVQGRYSDTDPDRQFTDDLAYHITPMDGKHRSSERCWCEPELVHEDELCKVFKHRRIQ